MSEPAEKPFLEAVAWQHGAVGLQGEGLSRGMQSQCLSCVEGLVSVVLQPVC